MNETDRVDTDDVRRVAGELADPDRQRILQRAADLIDAMRARNLQRALKENGIVVEALQGQYEVARAIYVAGYWIADRFEEPHEIAEALFRSFQKELARLERIWNGEDPYPEKKGEKT